MNTSTKQTVTYATDDCLSSHEILFQQMKIISKQLQWEGCNIAYWVFLIGVSNLTLRYMG